MLFFLSLFVSNTIHASELTITKDGRCKILQDIQTLSDAAEDKSTSVDSSEETNQ